MTWESAPIADAISRVVESAAPGQTATRRPDQSKPTLVVSYKEDFGYLWTLNEELLNWLTSDRHLIIVWDGAPDPGRLGQYNLTEYLTPADWAVIATLASSVALARVSILDFASRRYHGARSLKTFRQLRETLSSPLSHVTEIGIADLKAFITTLWAIASDHAPITSDHCHDRELLRTIWTAQLTEAKGGHHDISNIVGPYLLLESMGQTGECGLLPSALRKLLEVLRRSDAERASALGSWYDFKQMNTGADAVILIDDLAEAGWREFLAKALGLEQESTIVQTYLSPYPGLYIESQFVLDIPAYLEARLRWLENSRSGDPPALIPGLKCPLIFLDVRLFSHRPWRDERDFYSRLLSIAEKYSNLPNLGWPVDLSPAALKAARQFVESEDSGRESSEHHSALSLLPVLMAVADPTLPIILFSSTGRRKIIEPMIPCGNIILDFDKPRLMEDWNDSIDRAKLGFTRSVERAMAMLRTRSFLFEVTDKARAQRQKVEAFLGGPGTTTTRWKYAEIYIDEAGSGPEYIGGYVVLYENCDSGPSELYRRLRSNGFIWGCSREETPEETAARLSGKVNILTKAGDKLVTVSNDDLRDRVSAVGYSIEGSALYAACVLGIPDRHRHRGGSEFPDNAYRETISALLEIFLCDWLGVVSDVSGASMEVGVFVGTRAWNADVSKLIASQWDFGCSLTAHEKEPLNGHVEWRAGSSSPANEPMKTGFLRGGQPVTIKGHRNAKVLAQSMGWSDAYGLVLALSNQRALQITVRRAIAVTMSEGARAKVTQLPFLPPQVHYASDDFLGWLRRNKRMKTPLEPSLSGPLDRGFYAEATEGLSTVLRASRAVDVQDALAEALYHLHRVWRCQEVAGVTRWVATRAAKRIATISGREFLQFADRLYRN